MFHFSIYRPSSSNICPVCQQASACLMLLRDDFTGNVATFNVYK